MTTIYHPTHPHYAVHKAYVDSQPQNGNSGKCWQILMNLSDGLKRGLIMPRFGFEQPSLQAKEQHD